MIYHVAKNGAPLGELTEEDINSRLASGELSEDDLCWAVDMPDWQPLGERFAGNQVTPLQPPPPPPPPPTTADPNSSWRPDPGFEAAANPYAPPTAQVAIQTASAALGDHPGFWKRALGHIIDQVVTNAMGAVGGFVLGLGLVAMGVDDDDSLEAGGALIGIILAWLYYAFMESSATQATLGKMALGLVVTDLHGERISFGRATGRYFGMILSGVLLGIGFLMCVWTERKQCLHDSLAGCLIYRKRR